jgi:hypothetical protein
MILILATLGCESATNAIDRLHDDTWTDFWSAEGVECGGWTCTGDINPFGPFCEAEEDQGSWGAVLGGDEGYFVIRDADDEIVMNANCGEMATHNQFGDPFGFVTFEPTDNTLLFDSDYVVSDKRYHVRMRMATATNGQTIGTVEFLPTNCVIGLPLGKRKMSIGGHCDVPWGPFE